MKRVTVLILAAVLAAFADGCEMADREGFDPDPGVVPEEPPERGEPDESDG